MGGVAQSASSLGRLVAERAAHAPDGLAFTFSTRRGAERVAVTYGELAIRAGRIAAGLRARAPRGSVVACALPPGPDFIAAFCGTAWAGMISVPMAPPPLGGDRSGFDHILRQSRAAFVIAEETARHRLQGEGPQTLVWLAPADLEVDHAPPPSPADGGVAYLQYTSGSTGRPKGVMITHANVLDNSARIQDRFGHSPQSVGVIWLPPYHDMGLVGGILQPLFVGFPVHLFSPQDFIRSPLTWLRMISELGGTTSGGPNFAFEACVRRISEEQREGLNLSSWRVAFTGAEPIDPATLERFGAAYGRHGFRSSAFYPCYGLGEATLMVTGGRQGEGAQAVDLAVSGHGRRLVDCGDVVGDHDLQIVDPRSRRPVAEGELGEVWVAGPSVAAGYWRDTKATRKTFSARLHDRRGPYLRTGDLGRLVEGRLVVSGRLKASVVVRGVSHQLEDIERTVASSHPDLAAFQCAACVSDGEELHILQEAPAMAEPALGELRATICASLIQMHGIAPTAVTFLRPGRLPRTTSGKVRREDARRLADTIAA